MNFEEYVKEDRAGFTAKVRDISCKLGIDPNWLMYVMYFESRLNPKARNPRSKATGLIQFMPRTAISMGTTVDKIRSMSGIEQLDLVYEYLRPYKSRLKGWIDVYLAVFYPVAMGKGDSFTITSDMVAKQNEIFDINKDLDITVLEIKTVLREKMPSKYKHYYK